MSNAMLGCGHCMEVRQHVETDIPGRWVCLVCGIARAWGERYKGCGDDPGGMYVWPSKPPTKGDKMAEGLRLRGKPL